MGNKAHGLKRLLERGYRIPETWVIPGEVFDRYQANDVSLVEELCAALERVVLPAKEYAVRSSANVEDGVDHSFAGQFKSVLRLTGVSAIVQAVWSIWATAQSPAVCTYFKISGGRADELKMAVLVQEMVSPIASGVAFSKNPMTGTDEIVIEAVNGNGEALMQAGLTPLRWAWKWGNWISRPEDPGPLEPVAQRVVEGVRAIAKTFHTNVDLEWVWDGKQVTWVQMREITSLQTLNVYSNRMAKEMLPGAIKPLIWSVNVPLVNSAWIQILEEAVGKTGLKPENLAHPFYYHAYFNMTALGRVFNVMGFPSEGLEMMTGTVPKEAGKSVFRPGVKTVRILPRFFAFLVDKWNFAPKMKQFLERAPGSFQELRNDIQRIHMNSDEEVFNLIERLYTCVREAATYNILGPLLMAMYNQLLKGELRKKGVDIAHFNVTDGMTELAEMDPAVHLGRMHAIYKGLPVDIQTTVREGDLERLRVYKTARDFCRDFDALIARFGHLSDSGNDFSAVPWRDSPELILRLIPEQAAREDTGARMSLRDLKMGGWGRLVFQFIYQRARQFRLLREQISSLYTLGYGLFRDCYLELGRRLVERGKLDVIEDIFYLSRDEVQGVVGGERGNWRELINRRRAEVEASRGIVLPPVIYGEHAPPILESGRDMLNGTPTSRGYYTGPLRVVMGIADFYKVQPGDVLVVPFSDVSWTPLFARAGAVVAESGGMLSHSSIIAREYNIPAVVSVEGATQLQDGVKLAVDGYRGVVTILQEG